MSKTDKQVISTEYHLDTTKYPQARFNVDRFEVAIVQQGYNIYHERALRCPCINRGSNSALPNCQNCTGLGWFYIDKIETKALVQNMGNAKKYENWSETNAGTATVTSLYSDDMTYMDKLTLTDLEANFSQILNLVSYNGIVFCFTIYEPLSIENIYRFVSSNQSLQILYSLDEKPNDWDYFVEKNKLVFNPDKFDINDDISVTVRYKHHPVYAIVDIQREVFKVKEKGCSDVCEEENSTTLKGMPQKSIAKKLHYVWNAPNLDGVAKEFDNTDYSKYPNNTVEYPRQDDSIIA